MRQGERRLHKIKGDGRLWLQQYRPPRPEREREEFKKEIRVCTPLKNLSFQKTILFYPNVSMFHTNLVFPSISLLKVIYSKIKYSFLKKNLFQVTKGMTLREFYFVCFHIPHAPHLASEDIELVHRYNCKVSSDFTENFKKITVEVH